MTERERLDAYLQDLANRVTTASDDVSDDVRRFGVRRDQLLSHEAYERLLGIIGLSNVTDPARDHVDRIAALQQLVAELPAAIPIHHRNLITAIASEAGARIPGAPSLDVPLLHAAFTATEPSAPSARLSRLAAGYLVGHLAMRALRRAHGLDPDAEREQLYKVGRLVGVFSMLAEDTVGKIIMSGRRSRKGAARANVTKRHLREERRRQIEPLLARLWNDDPQRSARYYAPRIAAKLNVRGRTFKTETIRREIGPMVTELRKAAAVASRPRVRNV